MIRIGLAAAVAAAAMAVAPASAQDSKRSRLPTVPSSVIERALARDVKAPTAAPYISNGSGGGVVSRRAYGTAKHPYTTKRVAVQTLGPSASAAQVPVTSAPFRATGKMEVRFGVDLFDCTAALIRKGVLLTAAHCIHNYGQGPGALADGINWIPAEFSAAASGPYQTWRGRFWVVPTFYRDGTDTCDVNADGVVCNNDVALVVLHQNNVGGTLRWPGQLVGIYNWSGNGYSFVTSPQLGNKFVTQVSQLGYPSAFDNGVQMQRTESIGIRTQATGAATTNGKLLRSVIIGSAQTGGSSGGPWFANFGVTPVLEPGGAVHGTAFAQAIIGVTSFGTDVANDAGSSWLGQNVEYPAADYGGFGPGNVGFLLRFVCTQAAYAPACAP